MEGNKLIKLKNKINAKEYIIEKLNEQKNKYINDLNNINETQEEYYADKKDLLFNKDKINSNIHHSINQLIGFINYPQEYLIDLSIKEANKIISNLINMKISLIYDKENNININDEDDEKI
jgi:hypothetical protein